VGDAASLQLLAVEIAQTVRARSDGRVRGPRTGLTMLRRYWQFLLYLFIGLTVMELLLAPFRGFYAFYSSFIGYVGLSVEATLPLPQMLANARSRSCKGFRFSVLASWLAGDAMKMFWFFTSSTQIPWAFKLCGMFQASCDVFLGVQYAMYGNGEAVRKDHQMGPYWPESSSYRSSSSRIPSGRGTPTGRRTPVIEKDFR